MQLETVKRHFNKAVQDLIETYEYALEERSETGYKIWYACCMADETMKRR